MENNDIYISFSDVCDRDRFPHNIKLERLKSFETAITYIEDELEEWLESTKPLLITNDKRLYLKYRHAYSFEEFKKICNGIKLEIHPEKDFWYSINDGEAVLNAFEQICQGKGNYAYKAYSTERWTDEDTGQTYSLDHDNGWKIV